MLAPANFSRNAEIPPGVFRRYILENHARGLAEIVPGEPKEGSLYIVASGPSLLETWPILRKRPGEIWALNAAFDWLCRKGIRPDYGACVAPENAILRYFQEAGEGDKYLFASQTHPRLVDRVLERGGSVTLWHAAFPEEWDMPIPKTNLIYGAGTIGMRVFDLAWVLGWRDVHILGMDACNSADGRIAVDTPMYEDKRHFLRTYVVNGRAFVGLSSHIRQVEDFANVINPLKGMNVTLYGDGALQWSQTIPANSTTERKSHDHVTYS